MSISARIRRLVPSAVLLLAAAPSTDEIRARVAPLATVDPAAPLDDLAPFDALIGDARVIGLGEGTHGTREFFKLKHRFTRHLAETRGPVIFAIEASMPQADAVGLYVETGEGDPTAVVREMGWGWATEEVRDLVGWMRDARAGGAEVSFTGFDAHDPGGSARTLGVWIAGHAPERQADLAAIAVADDRTFARATFPVPVELARDRVVRLIGWIRTEDVAGGRAGLWCRVDGPERSLFLENMQDRGPVGTTAWREWTVDVPVSPRATAVVCGVLLAGSGTAWFDDLSVTIDTREWSGPDLGFEAELAQVEGDAAGALAGGGVRMYGGPSWETVRDAQAHSGAAALRLHRAPPLSDAELLVRAKAIQAAVRAGPATDVERRAATALVQALHRRGKGVREQRVLREEQLIANVADLVDAHSDATIVLWAHNAHVARRPGMMGAQLAARYGASYVPIALTTGTGEYRAESPEDGLVGASPLEPPPPGSLEIALERLTAPTLLLDTRRAPWLADEVLMRSIGADTTDAQFHYTGVARDFDGVVWVAESTAAHPL